MNSLENIKPVWIDPKDITIYMTEFNTSSCRVVVDGNWDKEKGLRPFNEISFYKDYKRRIEENLPWEETGTFISIKNSINKGITRWGCNTMKKLYDRLSYWDSLYESIKTKGYKDIGNERIGINVDRNGRISFNNGRHRLVFAKLLNIPSIPITINNVHTKWDNFKKEVIKYAQSKKGSLYSPIDHPDMQDVPYCWGHERFKLIRDNLSNEKGTMLDIGSHWGYFSGRFEELGYDVSSCESSPSYLYFLKKIRKANNKKFKVLDVNILAKSTPSSFDIVLALNIFHHFLKSSEKFKAFIEFLQRLECKEMYFQSHEYLEPQMRKAFKNFEPVPFVEFIIEHSCLNKYKCIGKDQRRKLFKLWQ